MDVGREKEKKENSQSLIFVICIKQSQSICFPLTGTNSKSGSKSVGQFKLYFHRVKRLKSFLRTIIVHMCVSTRNAQILRSEDTNQLQVKSSHPMTQPTEPVMEHASRPVKNELMTNITPYLMTNISLTYNSIAAYDFSVMSYQKCQR